MSDGDISRSVATIAVPVGPLPLIARPIRAYTRRAAARPLREAW
ncbi:hypothetical protein [Nocardia sp. BMG111209]|nr:hypothetical protein [Nocardia sp. BMG111209]